RVARCRHQIAVVLEAVDELSRKTPDVRMRGQLPDLCRIREGRRRTDGYRASGRARRSETDGRDQGEQHSDATAGQRKLHATSITATRTGIPAGRYPRRSPARKWLLVRADAIGRASDQPSAAYNHDGVRAHQLRLSHSVEGHHDPDLEVAGK